MEAVVTIRLDIAKSVFQVHGVDADGAVIVRRRLARAARPRGAYRASRRYRSARRHCRSPPVIHNSARRLRACATRPQLARRYWKLYTKLDASCEKVRYPMAKEAKSAPVELRIQPALRAAAERAAAKENRSLASLIEELLADHLRRGGFLTEDKDQRPSVPRRRSRHYETGD